MDYIYQDEEILILNKPAGLVTTRERNEKSETVEDWLGNFSWSLKLERSGICHRLDKDTSGILVVAKTKNSLREIKVQFKSREIKKTYLALVGGLTTKSGEIHAPICRSQIFGKWRVGIDGKEATTHFSRLQIYMDTIGKKYSYLELRPKTGRTHQIRVHCAYMGWPLVGDNRYGGDTILIKRQFLHASGLVMIHPKSRKNVEFESLLAADLQMVLDRLELV
jgi:23S rRNA pseudouridine1911/1915/1917 synthase